MKRTLADNIGQKMVLYHAVSSYQLLEVMLHRQIFHSHQAAVLVLPDFIVEKYPQYRKLENGGLFQAVYLFPYLHIPHREEARVQEDVARCFEQRIPHDLSDFSQIYVAGAHFYFSLYLIKRQVPFFFFEDAAGILSHWEDLFHSLQATFPIHAEIARAYGLFQGDHPCVQRIICCKRAQTMDVSGERYLDFSVEDALECLPDALRRRIIRFFLRRRLHLHADAILLTQHDAALGRMSEKEQQRLYERLREGLPPSLRLAVKPHPDDTLDYRRIFPEAELIRPIFPAELLPYVCMHKPDTIYTFDSSSCANLRKHFTIRTIRREAYAE